MILMTEEEKIYQDQTLLWYEEQKERAKEIRSAIQSQERILSLNLDQLHLTIKRANLGIQEYNEWAETVNAPKLPLMRPERG